MQKSTKEKGKNKKALLLFSGGLDSMIAVKVLQEQKLKVTGFSFSGYFFDTTQAKKSARQIGLKLISKDFSKKHLGIVQNPKNFVGKGLNPCIDCHGLMLKEAAKIAKEKDFSIIATGEVLGQRPLSQTKISLSKVEKDAGLKNRVLRPLSAKLLAPTTYEVKGLVDREALLSISGRGRKKQMALAKKFGIKTFPTPAGGCILAEVEFAKKLKALFEQGKKPQPSDFELLKLGRHLWGKDHHLVLGRNKLENEKIEKLALGKDILIKRKDGLGPTALVRTIGKQHKDQKELLISKAKKLITQRSRKKGTPKQWIVSE